MRGQLPLVGLLAVAVAASGCGAVSDSMYWSSRDATTVVSVIAVAVNGFSIGAAAWTLFRGPRWLVFLVAPFTLGAIAVAIAALFATERLAEPGDLTRHEFPIALPGIGPFFWLLTAVVRRFPEARQRIAAFVFLPMGVMHAFGFAVLAEKAVLAPPHGAPLVILQCDAEDEALFDDGTVWTWSAEHRAPRKIDVGRAVDVSCGCALQTDGDVRCWDSGELTSHVGSVDHVVRLAGTASRSCALRQGGAVACWERGSPAEPVKDVTDAIGIAVADSHACAVRRGGFVTCWGDIDEGVATAKLTDVVEVAVGEEHACARTTAGILLCWGEGPLGDGTTSRASTPIPITREVVQVAAAGNHTCARTVDGSVWCWGESSYGQSGTGATKLNPPEALLRPTRVELARPAVSLMVGAFHGCARSDRTFECWGSNDHDSLRIGVHERCSDDVGLWGSGTCAATPHPVTFVE